MRQEINLFTEINEIKYAFQSLHLNKSVGHDDIPSFFPKTGCDIILPILNAFLSFMFTNGIFPDNCKTCENYPYIRDRF